MKAKQFLTVTALTVFGTLSIAHAAVSPEEAKQLGSTLTWFGAEAGASADGSIPAYTGGLTTPPPGLKKGSSDYPDPYADEKPLYTVTPANMAQYADKLTEGQKTLLKKYADYRLDIYPTHRTFAAPKSVQDYTLKNATHCGTTDGGISADFKTCFGGIPYPIPKTGYEAIWNYLMRPQPAARRVRTTAYVSNGGRATLAGDSTTQMELPYYDPNKTQLDSTIYFRAKLNTMGPPRSAGEQLLQKIHVNPMVEPQQVWQYLPGQRRVRQAPELSFDTPSPQSGGLINMDQNEVFQGSPERYDMKLVGRKEMFIPANNYKFMKDAQHCAAANLVHDKFLNPECVRWELRRVVIVDATLKAGKRHSVPHRVFYLAEDGYTNAMSDDYDASGALYRAVYNFFFMFSEVPIPVAGPYVSYDFSKGSYVAVGTVADSPDFGLVEPLQERDWSSDALAGSGIR